MPEEPRDELTSNSELEEILKMPAGPDRQMALSSYNVRKQQQEREEREREEDQSTGSRLLDWMNLKRRRGLLR